MQRNPFPVTATHPILAHVSERWNQARAGLKLAKDLAKGAAKRAMHAAQQAAASAPAVADSVVQPPPAPVAVEKSASQSLASEGPEPPVVARLMVEIRSDGSRTIARGALQDELTGEQVAVEAKGNSPLELAGQLAKSLITAPLSLGTLRKAWLPGKKP